MNRNYKLTEECVELYGRKLYRIQALVDIPQHDVEAGDLGGYVEFYDNLCENAWIRDDAKVFGNAKVHGDAKVYEDAQVSGNAWIGGYAKVYGDAKVSGNAWVYDYARVFGNARVFDGARISGNAWVFGNAKVSGNVKVSNSAHITTGTITKTGQISTFQVRKGFYVTVTPTHAIIGCKTKTHEEWLKVTKKQAAKMGLSEELYSVYKSTLKSIIGKK